MQNGILALVFLRSEVNSFTAMLCPSLPVDTVQQFVPHRT